MAWIVEHLWIFGAVAVVAVGVQALWLTAETIRRTRHERRQRQRDAELLSLRIEAARKRRLLEQEKTLSWQGWRKFVVTDKVREDDNDETYSYSVAPHDGKPIPSFDPGQYITFRAQIPGDAKPTIRCYSLSDIRRYGTYKVTVKKVAPPKDRPELPPGRMSTYLQEQVQPGAIFDVMAPSGKFYLDLAHEKPIVLVGSGIGVTPMIAMVNAIAESGGSRETWLFYGVRNCREHIMKEHLENLARENPNIRLHVCYSRPREEDVEGRDYHHGERISVDLLQRVLPSNNYDFFLCGPPPMMSAVTEGLEAWGVPDERMHLETFGPSARKKQKKALDPTRAEGPQVTFRKSNVTVPWDPSAEHLWELAEAHDVKIEAGCLEGNCGTCEVPIVSGEVSYTKTPGYSCEAGTCLTCCAVPKGPLELDA